MIKNPKKFLVESEKERIEYLQSLTYEQSAIITEQLLSSKILLELPLREEDSPLSLKKAMEKRKHGARHSG